MYQYEIGPVWGYLVVDLARGSEFTGPAREPGSGVLSEGLGFYFSGAAI